VPAPTGIHQLMPIDEATTDPSLLAFRTVLLAAARAGDQHRVSNLMTPRLQSQLPERFIHVYDLSRLLALGGSFTTTRGSVHGRREFCAPYVYSAFPKLYNLPDGLSNRLGDGDAWVVLQARVPVKKEPTVLSLTLRYFSYEIVSVGGDDVPDRHSPGPRWVQIYLPGRVVGYVDSTVVRRTYDYAACFAKFEGQWRMTLFDRRPPLAAE
jgi:hypothetical protein